MRADLCGGVARRRRRRRVRGSVGTLLDEGAGLWRTAACGAPSIRQTQPPAISSHLVAAGR
jgi:hypothetical protein